MNKDYKQQYSQKDFDLGTEIEYRLCNVDVRSTNYRIYDMAMSYYNLLMKDKYNHSFYNECKIRKLPTNE